jgi:hypothetical protein
MSSEGDLLSKIVLQLWEVCMGWLFVGGALGLALRAVCWVIVWHLIGEGWHWLPHAIVSWLVGDFVATLVISKRSQEGTVGSV